MAPKRKLISCRTSTGGLGPRPLRMETEIKAPCEHRLYSEISSSTSTLSNNFSLQVAQHILQSTDDHSENVVISPLSMDAVLAVLAAGAEGETLGQLLYFLGFETVEDVNAAVSKIRDILAKSDAKNAPDISFANALWLTQKYGLNKSVEKILREVHQTEARAVDFINQADEVVAEANSWVAEQSKGLIKHIIGRHFIDENTRMILANALYFKGDWYHTFKPEKTKNKDFYLLNGDKIQVPFMHQYSEKFDYAQFDGYQVLRMMYKEGENAKEGETSTIAKKPKKAKLTSEKAEKPKSFSMYVFLPKKKDGLPNLMKSIEMNSTFFQDKINLKLQKIDELWFPKFAFECEFSLRKHMKEMGLKLPFEEENKDLKGMVDVIPAGENLYLNDVMQKCRVETNEEGTTAFVVTYAHLATMAARRPPPPPPVKFVADHPFMFMIMEDFSGAVLFVGTVLNPLST